MISSRIINSSFTDQGQLTPEQGFATKGPAQLDPNDEHLSARYSIAVLYFLTHSSVMFQSTTIIVVSQNNAPVALSLIHI